MEKNIGFNHIFFLSLPPAARMKKQKLDSPDLSSRPDPASFADDILPHKPVQTLDEEDKIVCGLRLRRIVKENHGRSINQIAFNPEPQNRNMVATVGDNQVLPSSSSRGLSLSQSGSLEGKKC